MLEKEIGFTVLGSGTSILVGARQFGIKKENKSKTAEPSIDFTPLPPTSFDDERQSAIAARPRWFHRTLGATTVPNRL